MEMSWKGGANPSSSLSTVPHMTSLRRLVHFRSRLAGHLNTEIGAAGAHITFNEAAAGSNVTLLGSGRADCDKMGLPGHGDQFEG